MVKSYSDIISNKVNLIFQFLRSYRSRKTLHGLLVFHLSYMLTLCLCFMLKMFNLLSRLILNSFCLLALIHEE